MGTMSSAPTSPDAGEWLSSKTPIAPPSSLDPKPRFLSYAALVTGVWSGLLSLIVFAIASLFGVPMDVVLDGTTIHVFWFAVLLVPIAAAQIGAMASLLLRGISHAQRIVFWIGTVIAVVSIVYPFMTATLVSTAVVLAIMHVITWGLVVPQIARIIGDTEPNARIDRPLL
jgi:hypothetical protein